MCSKTIKVDLDNDIISILNSIVSRKRRNIKLQRMGMVDMTRREIISEIVSDLLLIYGNDYLNKLKDEHNELSVKYGYRKKSDKDKIKELLGIGDING